MNVVVNMGMHHLLQHLDKPGTYARILFLNFSSAFNTNILLHIKLTQICVDPYLSLDPQLSDRQQ